MSWFRRKKQGITTPTTEKKETPDGLWYRSPEGNIIEKSELVANAYVSPEGHHERIGSQEYFELIFDNGWREFNAKVHSRGSIEI